MLKTNIKASHITNLTDARYFAAWDVKWVCFCLDTESEHFISPQRVAAIKEWIEGPQLVGAFGQQSAGQIQELVAYLDLSVIQLPHAATEVLFDQLEGLVIIKEIIVENTHQIIETIEDQISRFGKYDPVFLVNFDANNIEYSDLEEETIEELEAICREHVLVLNINLNQDELEQVLESIQPHGLQVAGGIEEKVGFKSFDELDDIFEALEVF